ncbi:MAG: hypothetical protein RLZZ369_392, partial [Pseudomonadota bacterium]
MLFWIDRSSCRTTESPQGASPCPARVVGSGLIAIALSVAMPAWSQQASPPVANTASAPINVTPPNSAAPSLAANNDPVSRFLVEKGLIDTSPVIELAQQVREKATDMASHLVTSAMDFLGVRYRRGGQSRESGFDCSGFTRHVFENSVGLILPRRASEQANSPDLIPVNQSELKPGDLVFFNTL